MSHAGFYFKSTPGPGLTLGEVLWVTQTRSDNPSLKTNGLTLCLKPQGLLDHLTFYVARSKFFFAPEDVQSAKSLKIKITFCKVLIGRLRCDQSPC